MKTFIAIPCLEQVPALFMQSLAMLRRAENTVVGIEVGSLVYAARNNLAQAAIKSEADQVLWLDSDMVFTPDFLEKMTQVRKENDIDFLTALCFRRKPPYTPTIYDRLDWKDGKCGYTQFLSIPEERFRVGGCGMAGVLMGTDVLMSVSSRYNGRMFDPLEGMGEDISFCWRARQCGYEIWCDPELTMGHVGTYVVTRNHFEAFQQPTKGDNDVKQSETGEKDQHDSL